MLFIIDIERPLELTKKFWILDNKLHKWGKIVSKYNIACKNILDGRINNNCKYLKRSSPGAAAVVAALASSVSDLRRFASRILQAAGPRSKPENKIGTKYITEIES